MYFDPTPTDCLLRVDFDRRLVSISSGNSAHFNRCAYIIDLTQYWSHEYTFSRGRVIAVKSSKIMNMGLALSFEPEGMTVSIRCGGNGWSPFLSDSAMIAYPSLYCWERRRTLTRRRPHVDFDRHLVSVTRQRRALRPLWLHHRFNAVRISCQSINQSINQSKKIL